LEQFPAADVEYLPQQFAVLREAFPEADCDWNQMEPGSRSELVLEKLEDVIWRVYNGQKSLEYPTLRDWNNVEFTPEHGLQPVEEEHAYFSTISGSSLNKFLHVLDVMRTLVATDTRTTKRDIFYQHFTKFSSQKEVDRLVTIAVAMLQVPRMYLGVVATSKGLVVGNIKWTNEAGVNVDCSLAVAGETIPQDVPELFDIVVDADFLIVVEKDAIFQRLLEEDVFGQELLSRAIFVTGKGVPDIPTRQLVSLLSSRMQVLVLTDCDPYGLEIYFTYKFGSLASTWAQEKLAAPSSLWLGVHPADMSQLGFPPSRLKTHSVADRKRILDFDHRDYVKADPQLREHLSIMWSLGGKAEIQQVAEEREPGFLVTDFLPMKIGQVAPELL